MRVSLDELLGMMATHTAGGGALDTAHAACAWVKAHADPPRAWLPSCAPGEEFDGELQQCGPGLGVSAQLN